MMTKSMASINLTVGIPCSNRPEKIYDCISSILAGSTIPDEIFVLDSSSSNIFADIKVKIEKLDVNNKVKIVHISEQISPSEARKKIADSTLSEYLLYLDDDMIVEDSSIEIMMEMIEKNNDIDILGCAVLEYGIWRDIGFKFDIGVIRNSKFVSKRAIRKEWMDLHSISLLGVDLITQPPFLIRRKVFESISFDENYKWAYEIYDFFFGCFKANISSYVTKDAFVRHLPVSYDDDNFKSRKVLFNKEGKEYFSSKWGVTPEKEFQKNKYVDIFYQLLWKYRKKKMVKNKIKKDGVRYN